MHLKFSVMMLIRESVMLVKRCKPRLFVNPPAHIRGGSANQKKMKVKLFVLVTCYDLVL